MSKHKHTPGPWVARDGAIYAPETNPVHGGKTCEECGHDPTECGPSVFVMLDESLIRDIRNGMWDDYRNGEGWTVADLRLIAAAPDMLEALMRIHAHGYDAQEYDLVRTAITKATGETP